ncbi:zinc-ribbon domain-containing protein [Rhodococcus sp. no. 34]
MLIFGTRTKTTFIAALFFACQLCRVTAAQRLHRRRTWFTLFILPIFPFGHGQGFMACAHCGQATALARPDVERFAADAAHYEAQRLNTETLR